MHGVYTAKNSSINYTGNRLFAPLNNISHTEFKPKSSKQLMDDFLNDDHLRHLHNIDSSIFKATVQYFLSINADWCNLPLTTKMISSPGEIYAGKKLNYTTDAMPVSLQWFDSGQIFLAESSQFYLEIRLLIENLNKVFAIYNSFRKEPADFSHLTEFQHIEFEGKVSFKENINIYLGLLKNLTSYLLKYNRDDLAYYLTNDEIEDLSEAFDTKNIETLTFKEAMALLADKMNDAKYLSVSLRNFGSYEEVALTRIVGKHCNVIEFPLEEIPFYHDASFTDKSGKSYGRNADLILFGYREVVGSGQRITSLQAIEEKAKFFNLPLEDYLPYIEMRRLATYRTTCGFGLGWQRYTQWLLKLPFIWDASHTPRTDHVPIP